MRIEGKIKNGGDCVAQSVKSLTLAQVMIAWFMSSSPASVSVLKAQSLEPSSDSLCLPLYVIPLLMLALSLSLSLKNKIKH